MVFQTYRLLLCRYSKICLIHSLDLFESLLFASIAQCLVPMFWAARLCIPYTDRPNEPQCIVDICLGYVHLRKLYPKRQMPS